MWLNFATVPELMQMVSTASDSIVVRFTFFSRFRCFFHDLVHEFGYIAHPTLNFFINFILKKQGWHRSFPGGRPGTADAFCWRRQRNQSEKIKKRFSSAFLRYNLEISRSYNAILKINDIKMFFF